MRSRKLDTLGVVVAESSDRLGRHVESNEVTYFGGNGSDRRGADVNATVRS
jgi:hypothetical protein